MILDLDRHAIQFDCDNYPFDRTGIVIVLGALADGHLQAQETPLFCSILGPPVRIGPGKEDGGGEVSDTVPCKNLPDGRISKRCLLSCEHFGVGEGWLDITAFLPGADNLIS